MFDPIPGGSMEQPHLSSYQSISHRDDEILSGTFNTFVPDPAAATYRSFQDTIRQLFEATVEHIKDAGMGDVDLGELRQDSEDLMSAIFGIGNLADEKINFDSMHVHNVLGLDYSVGGNTVVNPLWGFSPDDDVVHPLTSRTGKPDDTRGLGRVYNEMFQNNMAELHMSFGVPRIHGVVGILNTILGGSLHQLMGRGDIGLGGAIVGLVRGLTWGVAIELPYTFYKWIRHRPMQQWVSDYISFDPAMVQYYGIVNSILISMTESMGLTANAFNSGEVPGMGYIDKTEMFEGYDAKKSTPPEILRNNADIIPILTKRSRFLPERIGMNKAREPITYQEIMDDAQRENPEWMDLEYLGDDKDTGRKSWDDHVEKEYKDVIRDEDQDHPVHSNFTNQFKIGRAGELNTVTFRLGKGDHASESFSNEIGESNLGQKMTGIADEGLNRAFALDKMMELPVIKQAIQAMGFLKDIGTGIITGGASAEAALGKGHFDIPQMWKNSSWSRSLNFSMTLRAPYGDPLSIYQAIYVPLAFLLAGTLPRASSRSMYASPFNVRAFCKGRFFIPYGMIENLEIQRGDDEFGWNDDGLPTKVVVSFTIRDLTPVIYFGVPRARDHIRDRIWPTKGTSHFDEYINTLAGLSLEERLFAGPNFARRRKIAKRYLGRSGVGRLMNRIGLWGGQGGGSQAALARSLSREQR